MQSIPPREVGTERLFGNEVVEIQAHPTRFKGFASIIYRLLVELSLRLVDAK